MAAAPKSALVGTLANPQRVGTRFRRVKRARTEVADPPRALSGMPDVHPDCNWYVLFRVPLALSVYRPP